MEKPRCGSCRFFDPNQHGAYGTCVRFPAAVGQHQDNRCGEFVQIAVQFKEPAKSKK